MSGTTYYYRYVGGNAETLVVNGVTIGSYVFISLFAPDDVTSGTYDGISNWSTYAVASASPGTATLGTDYTYASGIMYGGGTQPNGVGGGTLSITAGSLSGYLTVEGGSVILGASTQSSAAYTLIDAYIDFEGGTGGTTITFNQDSTVKLPSPLNGNLNGFVLENFGTGDGIAAPTGYTFDESVTPVYTAGTNGGHGTLTFTLVDSNNVKTAITLSTDLASGATSAFNYTTDAAGDPVLAEGAYTTACYLKGTLIATQFGDVPVELLRIGDKVRTYAGESRAIRWIGTRAYALRYVAADECETLLPVRIAQGALGNGLPKRDLFVSPEHMMFLDGVLIPARHLVNGTSIAQWDPAQHGGQALEYFHIELDSHDVILAEGAPTESWLDTGNRNMFGNAVEFLALGLPEVEQRQAYAPIVTEGPVLDSVRLRLRNCQRELGIAQAA